MASIAALFHRSRERKGFGAGLAVRPGGGSATSAAVQEIAGRSARLALAATGAVLLFAVIPAPASAGTITSHQFVSSFDGSGTPAGSFGSFETGHYTIAVDSSRGRVYVLDRQHGVVDVFDEAGNYLAQIDGSTTTDGEFGFENPGFSSQGASIAVDQSGGTTQGRVYVASGGTLYAYSAKYAFLWETHQRILSVAVDSSGYVWTLANGTITRFNPDGVPVFSQQDALEGSGLSLDAANNFYTAGDTALFKYNSDLALVDSISVSLPRALAVDTSTGDVYTDHQLVSVFNSGGDLIDEFGSTQLEEDRDRGIAINQNTKAVYVIDNEARRIDVFETVAAIAPETTINSVTGITETEAHLSGSVNPEGHPTTWSFEYRPQGTIQWAATPTEEAGTGSSPVSVEADISGLGYGTVYQVRLFARSTDTGKVAAARTSFLTTPRVPIVTTLPAAPRTTTTARLTGRIDPSGAHTTYYFEYGPNASYGQSIPVSQDADGGTSRGEHLVSQLLTGLSPGTTYHYRIVAQNEKGPATGDDEVLTTRTAEEMQLPARGIELVNTPTKGDQSIAPPTGSFQRPAFISPDGERALWTVFAGTPDSTTGSAPLFLATRSAEGWHSQNLVPPAEQQFGGGEEHFTLQRVSADFSHFLFSSAHTLTNTPYAFMSADDAGGSEIVSTFPTPLNAEQATSSVQSSSELSHVVYLDWSDNQLYDHHSGVAELVSLMEDGEPPTCGVERQFIPRPYDWISQDASRIYFLSSGDECGSPPQIYLRDRSTETTTLVSGPPLAGSAEDPTFIRATADGAKALFATSAALLAEDTNMATDLYRFEESVGLTCLTCSMPTANPRAEVASPDLSYVYFTSRAQLDPPNGQSGVEAVYVWHEGTVHFVTGSAGMPGVNSVWTRLSADGSIFLFAKEGEGTTTDEIARCPAPAPGEQQTACIQLYRYDAHDQSIDCISCAPSGLTDGSVRGRFELSPEGDTIAFTTLAPLIRDDVNGTFDIYEWHNDNLSLISDGETKYPSKGLAVPEVWAVGRNSRDIFFSLAAPVTGFEKDGLANLYDARVGGGFKPQTPPTPCVEDACQGPLQAAPQLDQPGSATNSGPGNLQMGPKHRRHHHHRKHQHHRPHRKRHRDRHRHRHSQPGSGSYGAGRDG
jgi:hypothetical protein